MTASVHVAGQKKSASTSQALRESEASLNAIFDASPDPVLVCDADGAIVLASRQVEVMLGYNPQELLGQSIDMLVPERFRSGHFARRQRYLAAPSTRLMGLRREIRARRKDGSECDVEIGLSQISTTVGVFVATALRDISERKAAREQSEKLHLLFELSPLGIAMTDMRGNFLEFNQAFLDICGYSAEEMRGLDYWKLTPPRFAAEEARQLEQVVATRHYGPYEKEYLRKDGSLVPLRLNGVLVTGNDGQEYIWSIVEDITLTRQAEDKIRHLAFNDTLTGLPNRSLLQERLGQALAAAARSGMRGGILLIDLDNFKDINDTRGHGTGDMLLTHVAALFGALVGEGDTLARIGGDEFVLLMTNLGAERDQAAARAKAFGEAMLAALGPRIALGAETYQCTASIGATLFECASSASEDVMKQAELAMYRAKAAGRNALCFFDPAMEAAALARSALEADLQLALLEQQFSLAYQAQVDGARLVRGAEVLLRWQHPVRGAVAPADFIPVAEETGLILPLGQWVLETACRQLAAWAGQAPLAALTLAVNVSVHQFSQHGFVDLVTDVLARTGARPQRLKLELTESVLMNDVASVSEKMYALQAIGVRFSLDDFGTGYSSLAYLKKLPLDQLKIDQSFVRDVLIDANDAAIARTIVALAHSLQLEVIAEGVETAEQEALLKQAGCQAFQGYLYSRPLALAQFEHACASGALQLAAP